MSSSAKIEHTPTPWKFAGEVQRVDGDDLWCGQIAPVSGPKYRGEIARIQSADQIGGISRDEASANAAFIVTAVNSHADLVKALEELQAAETAYRMCHDLDGDGHINTGRAWDKLRQAGQRARTALSYPVGREELKVGL